MDNDKRRKLQIEQEELDDEYRRERREVEELSDNINYEKRQNVNDMDELYQGHMFAIRNVNEDFDDNRKFISNLEMTRDDFEIEVRKNQNQLEMYMEDYENDYRKKQRDLDDKLLEK